MPFRNTSGLLEESKLLERLRSVLLDDTSDTSSLETADDNDKVPDDCHGCSSFQEEARALPLQRSAWIKRCAPSCTFCDEDIGENATKELQREGVIHQPQKEFT